MIQNIKSNGYSDDTAGYSGAFSWSRSTLKPGKWYVLCYESSFANDGYAVTDDFGNLVRVPA